MAHVELFWKALELGFGGGFGSHSKNFRELRELPCQGGSHFRAASETSMNFRETSVNFRELP